jgi:anti-sigma B factor antagonist
MILKKTENPHVLIAYLQGRLDSSNAAATEHDLIGALENGLRYLVLDFSELDYINSAGLRILVLAYQHLQPRGGRLVVCGAHDYITEIFEISGYNRIFLMQPDLEQAMRTIGDSEDGQRA